MDPSAACTTSRLQNFPFPTSQCPKVKRYFNLEIACSQTSSPPPAISSTATPTMPWYLCCVFLKTKHTAPRRMSRIPDLWLQQGNSSSILSCHRRVHQLFLAAAPKHHETLLGLHQAAFGRSCFVSMAAHRLQDCHKKPFRVSVGECDSMSRRSRSVKPLIMSLALARRPDGMLSSGFQVRAQRVSTARSGQRAWACAVSSRDKTPLGSGA